MGMAGVIVVGGADMASIAIGGEGVRYYFFKNN